MMCQRAWRLGFMAALCLLPMLAHAAVDVDMARDLVNTLKTFDANITSKLGLLQPEGRKLTYVLLGIAIAWTGLAAALKQTPFNELVAEVVVVAFAGGMVLWFINGTDVLTSIDAGFTQIASKIMATVTGGGDASSAVAQAVNALLQTAVAVSDLPLLTENGDASWFDKIVNAGAEVGNAIMALLYQLFMAAMLVVVALIYMGSFIMSQTMVGLAMIIAPVIIPFYLIRPLSFLATGWFQFFVSAGMVKVGGALLMALTMGFLQTLAERFAKLPPGQAVPFSVFANAFLIVGVMAFMMLQVWNIGSTIASGPARLGLAMPSRINPASAAKGTSNTASSAARHAPGAAVGAAGAVGGAVGGAAAGARGGGAAAAAGGGGRIAQAAGAATGAVKGATNGAVAGGRAAKQAWESNGKVRNAIREGVKAGTKSDSGLKPGPGGSSTPGKGRTK